MAIDLRWRSVSFYNDISLFPIVGSINILYVDRAAMLIYIWNGSSYEATEGGSGGSSITVVANYAALPDPTTVTASFYWCSASQGTAWLPGSLGGSYYNSGLYYSNGTSWEYMSSPYQATQVEVDAGVISDKFVTPNTLYNSSKWGTKQNQITLTTTGSGAATFIADTLNIPTPSGGTPAGITGQIQFNNAGSFGADSGLFWDNTNKRLGVGATPATTVRLDIRAQGALSTDIALRVRNSADTQNLFSLSGNGNFTLGLANSYYISLNPSSPSLRGYNSTNVAWQLSPWTGEHSWITSNATNQTQVGIGTTAPNSKLHVYTSVDDTAIKIATGASLVANETACLKFSTTNAGTSFGQDALIIRARSKGTSSGDQKCSAEFSLNRNGTNALKASITSQSNLLLQAPTEDTNDIGVIYIPNGTAPTANLAGGGKLYVEGGELKYRGSSGTVTVLGVA